MFAIFSSEPRIIKLEKVNCITEYVMWLLAFSRLQLEVVQIFASNITIEYRFYKLNQALFIVRVQARKVEAGIKEGDAAQSCRTSDLNSAYTHGRLQCIVSGTHSWAQLYSLDIQHVPYMNCLRKYSFHCSKYWDFSGLILPWNTNFNVFTVKIFNMSVYS